MSNNIIRFRLDDKKTAWLSNFYYSRFYSVDEDYNNIEWRTVEHYFQAMKFNDVNHQEKIRNLPTPKEARQLGKQKHHSFKLPWDALRIGYMYLGLSMKFDANKILRQKLLETGDATLIEYAPWDSFWGDGGDGSGKNMLGKQLMLLRENLKMQDSINMINEYRIIGEVDLTPIPINIINEDNDN